MGFFFLPLTKSEQVGRFAGPRVCLYAVYPLRSIINVQRAAVTRSREAGGCCHAVIRFPSHFQRPLRATRERSPVSFPLSSSRPSRATTRTASVARDGDADKLTRDACVGSRAVRTSVPRARSRGDERSAQRAPSPCERGDRGRSSRLDSSIKREREREREIALCDHLAIIYRMLLPSFGVHENSRNCSRQLGEKEKRIEYS